MDVDVNRDATAHEYSAGGANARTYSTRVVPSCAGQTLATRMCEADAACKGICTNYSDGPNVERFLLSPHGYKSWHRFL